MMLNKTLVQKIGMPFWNVAFEQLGGYCDVRISTAHRHKKGETVGVH